MVKAMESGGNMEYDSKRVEYSNRMKFLAQSKWSLLSVFFEACNSGKHSKRNIPHLFWQCRAQEYGRMNSPDLWPRHLQFTKLLTKQSAAHSSSCFLKLTPSVHQHRNAVFNVCSYNITHHVSISHSGYELVRHQGHMLHVRQHLLFMHHTLTDP